jgi:hypothetical protein
MSDLRAQSGGPRSNPLPLPPEEARSGSVKDTKRWCRGIVGREHSLVWQFWFECGWKKNPVDYQRLRCTTCGRDCGVRTVPSHRPSHSNTEGGDV